MAKRPGKRPRPRRKPRKRPIVRRRRPAATRAVVPITEPFALASLLHEKALLYRAAARSPATRRAQDQDLAHFWSWARAKHNLKPRYPVPGAYVLDYLYDHDAPRSPENPHGPDRVPSPNTLQRRISTLSQVHRDHRVPNTLNPCLDPQLRQHFNDLKASRRRKGWEPRQPQAATLDVLNELLLECRGDVKGMRDHALLSAAWSSGGRRPSEMCNLDVSDIEEVPVTKDDSAHPHGQAHPNYLLRLRSTKTELLNPPQVPVLGQAAASLKRWLTWLKVLGHQSGPAFPSITKGGRIRGRLTTKQVSRIIKRRAEDAGIDAGRLSGHSMRSGFMTQAGREGISLQDAMQLSRHKSPANALIYHRPGEILHNPAASLADRVVLKTRVQHRDSLLGHTR